MLPALDGIGKRPHPPPGSTETASTRKLLRHRENLHEKRGHRRIVPVVPIRQQREQSRWARSVEVRWKTPRRYASVQLQPVSFTGARTRGKLLRHAAPSQAG